MLVPARNDYNRAQELRHRRNNLEELRWALMRSGKRAVRQCSRTHLEAL